MNILYINSKRFSFLPVLLAASLWFSGGSVFGQTTQTLTSDGTWVVPCGVTSVTVELWGAGGGSGRSDDGTSGGGGGGGYVQVTFAVTPGQSIPYNVGTVDDPASPGDDGSSGGGTVGGGLTDGYDGWNTTFLDAIAQGGEGGTASPSAQGGAGGGTGTAGANSGGSGTAITIINGSPGANGSAGGAGGSAGAPGAGSGANGTTDSGGGTTNGLDGSSGQIVLTYVSNCNDSPCNAEVLTPLDPCVPFTANNVGAGGSGVAAPSCGSYSSDDIWYEVVVPSDGVLTVDFTAGSMTDAATAVYTGPDCSTLTQYLCDDDGGAGTMPVININDVSIANQTVYIRVWDFGGGTGDFDMCVTGNSCTTTTPAASCTDCASEPSAGNYLLTACDDDATLSGNAITQGTGNWILISGSGTITSPASTSTTVTGLGDGTNIFAWQVTDSPCPPLQDAVTITVDLGGVSADAGTDIITCDDEATLNANDPTPGTGQWIISGPNVPTFSTSDTDPNTTISGLINGTYNIEWRVTGPCGVISDFMTVTVGNTLPAANAGPDQSGVCPTNTTLAGDPVVGITGTWTQVSGPATAGFIDANDGTTMVYGLTTVGSYEFEWTLTGGGCTGSSSDQVLIDVTNCTNTITHDPTGDQTVYGCNYTYTDDGGTASDYSEGVISTQTVFCPDDPSQFVTVDFTSLDLGPYIYDNLVVFDSNNPAAPMIGYADGAGEGQLLTPASGDPIVASNTTFTGSQGGCLYFTFTSVDIIAGDDAGTGWVADIGCSTTSGTPITQYISGTNCGGLGGITLCENNQNVNPDTQFQGGQMDLNVGASGGVATPGGNNGCLGSGESNEQWVYFNVETSGNIQFEFNVAGGQDFDFAIWGPYSYVSCPVNTGDAPIRCSWATTGNNGCTGSNLTGLAYTVPAGVYTAGQSTAGDFYESGEGCINDGDGMNDGYVAPIEALAGEVYVMLVNNYANNNSNYTFSYTGTAGLGCDAPAVLGVSNLELNGYAHADFNRLKWTTSSEENNSHFVVQGSTNGHIWKELGIVYGHGTSNELSNYFFDDRQLVLPLTYYRLIQVDTDGTETTSKTIAVNRDPEINNIISAVFPNPANDKFYFNYGGNDMKTPLQVSVYNNLGQLVYYNEYDKFNKHMSIEVDATYLKNGMYNVKVEQGEKSEVQKLTIFK